MNTYMALTLVCSFSHAVGAVLCKYGLENLKHLPDKNLKRIVLFLVRSKFWVLGLVVTLSTNVFVLQLQSVLDISVVQSILNSGYIFTLLLGYLVLDEVLTKQQLVGTIAVIIGALAIMTVDNPVSSQSTNIEVLLIQSGISFLIICLLILFSFFYENVNYEILYAISGGIAFGNSQVCVKATTNYITDETGYFSVFSMQSVTEFVNVWPTALIVLFGITGFICMQISFTHGKVSICVALLAVISRTISTSSGYYIFGEEFPYSKLIGIVTILVGVFIITMSTIKRNNYEISARPS